MKKVFIGIGVAVILIGITITTITISSNNKFNKNLKSQGLTGIGKEFTVETTQNSDYTVFEDGKEFDVWVAKERNKMIKYMKEKNLKLKAGTYTINSAHTFEKVLEILNWNQNKG